MLRAAIDIGTNTCRLLIVEQKGEQIETIRRHLIITRIGQGIGKQKGQLTSEGMERTLKALKEFQALIAEYPVVSVDIMGTQALREAANSGEFCSQVNELLGWQIDIISGEKEAYLSYLGAVSAMPELKNGVILDIGGGSTEIITKAEDRIYGASAPVGCLRLMEKPLPDEEIRQELKKYWRNVRLAPDSVLVGVGGTATTLGAIFLKMEKYDADALLQCIMKRSDVRTILDELEAMSMSERRKLPGMLPGREDVMPYGLIILLNVMDIYDISELRICDRDLMYGILLDKYK